MVALPPTGKDVEVVSMEETSVPLVAPVMPVPYSVKVKKEFGDQMVKPLESFENQVVGPRLKRVVKQSCTKLKEVREVKVVGKKELDERFVANSKTCGRPVVIAPGCPPLQPSPPLENAPQLSQTCIDSGAYPIEGYPSAKHTREYAGFASLPNSVKRDKNKVISTWVTRWHTAASQPSQTLPEREQRVAALQKVLNDFVEAAVDVVVHCVRNKTPARDKGGSSGEMDAIVEAASPNFELSACDDGPNIIRSSMIPEHDAFPTIRKTFHPERKEFDLHSDMFQPQQEEAPQKKPNRVDKANLYNDNSPMHKKGKAREANCRHRKFNAPSGCLEIEGLCLSFASCTERLKLFSTHEAAMKTVSHKHRNLDAIFASSTKGLGLYPYCTITYLGHRVFVRPILPLVHSKQFVVHKLLSGICEKLNLRPHWSHCSGEATEQQESSDSDEPSYEPDASLTMYQVVKKKERAELGCDETYPESLSLEGRQTHHNTRLFIPGPRGLKLHKSLIDNRLYLTSGVSRLFPSVPNDYALIPQGYLFRHLRRELLAMSTNRLGGQLRLSSDSYSPFGGSRREEHDTETALMTDVMLSAMINHLLNDLIVLSYHANPNAAFSVLALLLPGEHCENNSCKLSRMFHARGVNMRYLGLAYQYLMYRLRRIKAANVVPLEYFDKKDPGPGMEWVPKATNFIVHLEGIVAALRTEMVLRCVKDMINAAFRIGGGSAVVEILEILFGDEGSFEATDQRNLFFFDFIVPKLEEKFGKAQGANIEKYHFSLYDISKEGLYNKLLLVTGLRVERSGVEINRFVETRYFTKGLKIDFAMPVIKLPAVPKPSHQEGEVQAVSAQIFAMLRATLDIAEDTVPLADQIDEALSFIDEVYPNTTDPCVLAWKQKRKEQILKEEAIQLERIKQKAHQKMLLSAQARRFENEHLIDTIKFQKLQNGAIVGFDVRSEHLLSKWGLTAGQHIEYSWPPTTPATEYISESMELNECNSLSFSMHSRSYTVSLAKDVTTYEGIIIGERSGWLWRANSATDGAVAFHAKTQEQLLERYQLRVIEDVPRTLLKTLILSGEYQAQLRSAQERQTKHPLVQRTSTHQVALLPSSTPLSQRKNDANFVKYPDSTGCLLNYASGRYALSSYGVSHGDLILFVAEGDHQGRLAAVLGEASGQLSFVDSTTGLAFAVDDTALEGRLIVGRRAINTQFDRLMDGTESNPAAASKAGLYPRQRVVITDGPHSGATAVVQYVRAHEVSFKFDASKKTFAVALPAHSDLRKVLSFSVTGIVGFFKTEEKPALSLGVSMHSLNTAERLNAPQQHLSQTCILDWVGRKMTVDVTTSVMRAHGGSAVGQVMRIVKGRWLLRTVVLTGVAVCPETRCPCIWGVVDGYEGSVPLLGCTLVATPYTADVMVVVGEASAPTPRHLLSPFTDVPATTPFQYLSFFGSVLSFDISFDVLSRFNLYHGQEMLIGPRCAPAYVAVIIGVYRDEVWVRRTGNLHAEPLQGSTAVALQRAFLLQVRALVGVVPFHDPLRSGHTSVTQGTAVDLTSDDPAQIGDIFSYISSDYELIGLDSSAAALSVYGSGLVQGDRVEDATGCYTSSVARVLIHPESEDDAIPLHPTDERCNGRQPLTTCHPIYGDVTSGLYGATQEYTWRREGHSGTVIGAAGGMLYVTFDDSDGASAVSPEGVAKLALIAREERREVTPIKELQRRALLQKRDVVAAKAEEKDVEEHIWAKVSEADINPHLRLVKREDMVAVARLFAGFETTELRRALEITLRRSGLDLQLNETEADALRRLAAVQKAESSNLPIPSVADYHSFCQYKDSAVSLEAHFDSFLNNAHWKPRHSLMQGGFVEMATRKTAQLQRLKKIRLKEVDAKRLMRVQNHEDIRSLAMAFQSKAQKTVLKPSTVLGKVSAQQVIKKRQEEQEGRMKLMKKPRTSIRSISERIQWLSSLQGYHSEELPISPTSPAVDFIDAESVVESETESTHSGDSAFAPEIQVGTHHFRFLKRTPGFNSSDVNIAGLATVPPLGVGNTLLNANGTQARQTAMQTAAVATQPLFYAPLAGDTTATQPPPLTKDLFSLTDRCKYVLRNGDMLYLDTSEAAMKPWELSAGWVVKYNRGDLAGTSAMVLGVYQGRLWRYDFLSGYSTAAPFAGSTIEGICAEHKLTVEDVSCSIKPRAADPFLFPLWDTNLAMFDISAESCERFGVRHGERYACGVTPPLLIPVAAAHPSLVPFTITIIGVHGKALWYSYSDRAGAVFFSGSNIREEFLLSLLYMTSVEEVATDSEGVISYLGRVTSDGQLPSPAKEVRKAGKWAPLLFETGRGFAELGAPHLHHGCVIEHANGRKGFVVGTARHAVWTHLEGDQGATIVPSCDLHLLQPQGETVAVARFPLKQSKFDEHPFRYHTTANNIALFDRSALSTFPFGVTHGEVVAISKGSDTRKALVIGVRNKALWVHLEGDSGATPLMGANDEASLCEIFKMTHTGLLSPVDPFTG